MFIAQLFEISQDLKLNVEYISMSEKIIVNVDGSLKPIIPSFLDNRQKDIEKLKTAIEKEDQQQVKIIGHQIKGNSGCYGLITLGKFGEELEEAAKKPDWNGIQLIIQKIIDHLEHLEIEFD